MKVDRSEDKRRPACPRMDLSSPLVTRRAIHLGPRASRCAGARARRAPAILAILTRARTRVRILAVYQLHAARVPRARRRQRGRACQSARQWWVCRCRVATTHRVTTTVVARVARFCVREREVKRTAEIKRRRRPSRGGSDDGAAHAEARVAPVGGVPRPQSLGLRHDVLSMELG